MMAIMSTPIYGSHGLFTRGSLDRMADQIGLVDPINDLTGVCTAIYPYATTNVIDCIIIEKCKKIVVSGEHLRKPVLVTYLAAAIDLLQLDNVRWTC